MHIQIMQCCFTDICRAKLLDSQSVFVFSVGGLDTTQYRHIEIDRIGSVLQRVLSRIAQSEQ